MKTKTILIGAIVLGSAFLLFNSYMIKRSIAELRAKLDAYAQNPPSRSNMTNWIDWIQTALDWTAANKGALSNLWNQGGAFFGQKTAPSVSDVDALIKSGDLDYSGSFA